MMDFIRSATVELTSVTVAQVLLRYLELEGVCCIFGIPGGGEANLLTELKNQRSSFQYVVCRHETGAVYLADGFHRITGKLGVVLVTTGPGATNAVTGAMNAQAGGSALLVLTGEVNECYQGMGYLQEGLDAGLNVNAIYLAATRYSAVVSDQTNFQTLLAQALRDALSIPRRAVHLSLPNNVVAETVQTVNLPRRVENYRALPSGTDPPAVRRAFDHLRSARFPLIFLGNGSRSALIGERLQRFDRFVSKHAIPVVTTADGKGIFPETHHLSLRVYGFASCAWPQYWMIPSRLESGTDNKFDALLVLGSSLNDLGTNKWDPMLVPNGPFMQVDLDQSVIGRSFHVDLGVVGEIGAFLDELFRLDDADDADDEGLPEARLRFVGRIKAEHSPFFHPEQYESEASPIQPAALMRILNELLPDDAAIFLDAGNCVGWGNHCLIVDPPRQIFSALAMGPMGFAVGAVVGGAMGAPDRVVCAIVGDGAFMMHGAEVSTAAKYSVGAIWFVLNDDDLHMVTQGQEHFFPDKDDPEVWSQLYKLGDPSLDNFARGLGADAYVITSPHQLRNVMPTVLERSRKGIPQVVIAKVDLTAQPPYYVPDYITASPLTNPCATTRRIPRAIH